MHYPTGVCFAVTTTAVGFSVFGTGEPPQPPPDVPFITHPTGPRYASYYDTKTKKIVPYRIPGFAQVKKYRFLTRGETFTAEIVLASKVPKNLKDRLTFEVYFAKPGRTLGYGLIAPLGNYTYHSVPRLTPGTAGVIDVLSAKKVGEGRVMVQEDRVTISCDKSAIAGKMITLGMLRYVPRHENPDGTIYGGITQEFYVERELARRQIVLPGHPSVPRTKKSGPACLTRPAFLRIDK